MSTAAQTAANRSNSQLSTGPVTSSGKAISSRNRLRHGFRSAAVLIPGDDIAGYEALLARLTAQFTHPDRASDLIEFRCIREMADAEWQLRRVRQCLEDALTRRIQALTPLHPDAGPFTLQCLAIETLGGDDGGASYATWLRYEAKFERQYDRACRHWTTYQNDCRRAAAQNTNAIIADALRIPEPFLPPPDAAFSASNVQTPRSALCPCNSGEKFKRCCGKNAPPVLSSAFPHAA